MPKKSMNKSQIIATNDTSPTFNLKAYMGEEEKDDNKFFSYQFWSDKRKASNFF